jgi:hypothetical protein
VIVPPIIVRAASARSARCSTAGVEAPIVQSTRPVRCVRAVLTPCSWTPVLGLGTLRAIPT